MGKSKVTSKAKKAAKKTTAKKTTSSAASKKVAAKKVAPKKVAAKKVVKSTKTVAAKKTAPKKVVASKTAKPVAKKAPAKPVAKKAVQQKAKTQKKEAPKAVKKAPVAVSTKQKAAAPKKTATTKTAAKAVAKKVVAVKKPIAPPKPNAKKAAAPKVEVKKPELKKADVKLVLKKSVKEKVPSKSGKSGSKKTPLVKVDDPNTEVVTTTVSKKELDRLRNQVKEAPVTTRQPGRLLQTKKEEEVETVQAKSEKTRYSDSELEEFRQLITTKLDDAKSELKYLQEQISRTSELGDDSDSRFKGLEDGSSTAEKEYLSQMASRQIQYISHLEKALIRIQNKTYGICRETGKLISKERLRAVPHATLSIEAKKNQS